MLIRLKDSGLGFNAFIPSEPSIKVTSKEILTTTEFVSLILSTSGTWFGISVLALNSFNFKKKKVEGVQVFTKNGNPSEQVNSEGRKRSNFTWSKMVLNFSTKNNQGGDELQQLIITLTGRVTQIEKFVYNYRNVQGQDGASGRDNLNRDKRHGFHSLNTLPIDARW